MTVVWLGHLALVLNRIYRSPARSAMVAQRVGGKSLERTRELARNKSRLQN